MAIDEKELDLLIQDEAGKYIQSIKIEGLYQFVRAALIKYGDINKLLTANRIVELTLQMLDKKKQLNDAHGNVQSFVEIIKVAALLHNMFYNGTVSSLFIAREKLTPLAIKYGVPENYISALFQTIESQLGDDTPVPQCRPIQGTPTELFAWACWFIDELHGGKKLPSLNTTED